MQLKKKFVPNNWGNLTLFITTVGYLLSKTGAGLWEEANVVPLWTSAPPASFHIFQGPYGLRYKAFWIIGHSIHDFFL